MKKILLIMILCFACLISNNSCEAIIEGQDNHGTLTADQLVLGYIAINDNTHVVRKIYGNPSWIDRSNAVRWYYGRDFYILFLGGEDTAALEK